MYIQGMKAYQIPSALSLLLVFSNSVFASPADLQHGQSRSEVITIMGPPLDKSERAVKHEEVWAYKNLTLTFQDGLLARWNRDDGEEATTKAAPPTAQEQSKHPTQSLTFQELLKNIPDEGNSGNQANGMVGQPMQIQPMMDSPGANIPPPGQPPIFGGGTSPGMSGLLEKLREQRGLGPQ